MWNADHCGKAASLWQVMTSVNDREQGCGLTSFCSSKGQPCICIWRTCCPAQHLKAWYNKNGNSADYKLKYWDKTVMRLFSINKGDSCTAIKYVTAVMKLLLDKKNNLVLSISWKLLCNSFMLITISLEQTIQIQNTPFTIMSTMHVDIMGNVCNIHGGSIIVPCSFSIPHALFHYIHRLLGLMILDLCGMSLSLFTVRVMMPLAYRKLCVFAIMTVCGGGWIV